MQLRDILKSIKTVKVEVDLSLEIKGITGNSKKIEKGFIFAALKGARFDGNAFIGDAMDMGAVCVVTDTPPISDVPYILVENVRESLSMMLSNFYGRPQDSFKVSVGITGTNGKTSTSVMLKNIFEEAGMKVGLIGTMKYLIGDEEYDSESDGNHLTTPDSENFWSLLALMREKGVEALVMEVSSHALELGKIYGMHFTRGVFTNLTRDHLDFHHDFDNYKKAKAKLFSMCDMGIVNEDDQSSSEMIARANCPVKTYSIDRNSSDFTAKNVRLKGALGVEYELLAKDLIFRVKVNIPGKFTVYNSLAAVTTALTVGVGCDTITKGLLNTARIEGRVDRVDVEAPFSVIIDFAHTPDAMENVLKTVRGFAEKRIISIFGCGGDRDKTKRPIMGKMSVELSDFVVITSDNSRTENTEDIIKDIVAGIDGKTNFEVVPDRKDAIKRALDIAEDGDVVLLLGKGHEEYEIGINGKVPFSEREIVKEYFNTK